jgi:hypothetical protein
MAAVLGIEAGDVTEKFSWQTFHSDHNHLYATPTFSHRGTEWGNADGMRSFIWSTDQD